MAKTWNINLPGPLPNDLPLKAEGRRQALVVTVPDSWCYHILRPAPPGGWSRRLRDGLRPGLFPEPMNALWSDETIQPDGSWEVWAIAPARILPLFPQGRFPEAFPARITTRSQSQAGQAIASFPNMAPPVARPRRLPWKSVRRIVACCALFLALATPPTWVWHRQKRELSRLQATLQTCRNDLGRTESLLAKEKAIIRLLDPKARQGSEPFLVDLDALTRLIPEDTYAIELTWSPDRLSLTTNSPRPEVLREALEAASDFRELRFEGTMDRKGDRSRLTLSMRPAKERR